MKSRDYSLKSVDEYVARAPAQVKPKLQELREVILSAVSQIEEGISWGQPYYRKNGLLVGFDFYKDYVRFGFGPSFDKDLRNKLEAIGYKPAAKPFKYVLINQFQKPILRK